MADGPVYKPLGRQKISPDSSTAVGLSVPAGACRCLIAVETQNVRVRDDGTDPTSSTGLIIQKDSQPMPYEGDLSKIKFIAVASTAAVEILYYGQSRLGQ